MVTADDGVTVVLDDGDVHRADAVVVATDLVTTGRLVGSAAGLDDPAWQRRVAKVRAAPRFAVWRLWLDRPVTATRPAFLGTSGYGPLDNITVLERFEAGAAAWVAEHHGSVVEVHAYALADEAVETQVRERLRTELARVYPETADARVVADEWLVSDDCPLVGTGPWADRLEVRTPDSRVVLAGDGIRCDYPVALMERAATTGMLAANALLSDFGLAGHDIWTVPMRSRHADRRPRSCPRRSAGVLAALPQGVTAFGVERGRPPTAGAPSCACRAAAVAPSSAPP